MYSFILTVVTVMSVPGQLGLDNLVVRQCVKPQTLIGDVLGTAFALRAIALGLCALVATIVVFCLRPDHPDQIRIGAIMACAGLFAAAGTADLWFQMRVDSKYVVIRKNVVLCIASVAYVIAIATHQRLVWFAWAYLGQSVATAIGQLAVYQYSTHGLATWRFRWPVAVSLLKDSWPNVVSELAILVYMRIDQVMLGQMEGDYAVGVYTIVTRMSELWFFVPTALASSALPAILRAHDEGKALFNARLQRFVNVTAAAAIASVAFTLAASSPIIRLLFGARFMSAVPVLYVHVWSSIFVFMGVATSPWFLAEDKLRYRSAYTVGGALVNIALNFALIPAFGIMGAAIATLVSYCCQSVVFPALSPVTRPVTALQYHAVRNLLRVRSLRKES